MSESPAAGVAPGHWHRRAGRDSVPSGVLLACLSVLAGLLFAAPAVALPPPPAKDPPLRAERHASAESVAEDEKPVAVHEQDDEAPATTDPPAYSESVVVTATRDEETIVDSVGPRHGPGR